MHRDLNRHKHSRGHRPTFRQPDALSHSLLGELDADDHTQYSLADGSRDFSGVVSGVTPTADAHLSTKKYVDDNDFFSRSGSALSTKTAGDSLNLGGRLRVADNAETAVAGDLRYNTSTNKHQGYNGSTWNDLY